VRSSLRQEELAVHKQKIEQVSRWLNESFSDFHRDTHKVNNANILVLYLNSDSRRKRILALTGPSGAGKTATITALARSMSIQITEWKSGLDDWRIGDIENGSDGTYYMARLSEISFS
jgi:cell cycle checkpoint protein